MKRMRNEYEKLKSQSAVPAPAATLKDEGKAVEEMQKQLKGLKQTHEALLGRDKELEAQATALKERIDRYEKLAVKIGRSSIAW
jgi:phage shock protein A